MGRITRFLVASAGGCCAVLAAAVPASAVPWPDAGAWASCDGDGRICVDGPVGGGNVENSQNVRLEGASNNSGSPTGLVFSPNSNNTVQGSNVGSNNQVQDIGGAQHG